MKKFKLIVFLIVSSAFCFGQPLQQGVFTTVTLETAYHTGIPQVGGCHDWELYCFNNCYPFVTGMNLYFKIDSISGGSNSIQLWRFPDISNIIVNANDTIPLYPLSNTLYVYYLNNATLFVSLIAVGTPQISGENYFCNYSSVAGVQVDGCGLVPITHFSGGNGAMDTIKGCSVLNPTAINEIDKSEFEIYPNPVKDKLILNFADKTPIHEIRIYNLLGEIKSDIITHDVNINIDVTSLSNGIYILEIFSGNKFTRQKFIRRYNSR